MQTLQETVLRLLSKEICGRVHLKPDSQKWYHDRGLFARVLRMGKEEHDAQYEDIEGGKEHLSPATSPLPIFPVEMEPQKDWYTPSEPSQ